MERLRLPPTRVRDRSFGDDAPAIMGILNVTPDSFSDGGRFADVDRAVEHALQMQAEGADLIDVGGESTRPGSEGVSAEVELARVLPVIQGIRRRSDVPLSIDTSKAEVARAAVEAGAGVINDITALAGDPAIAEVAAATGAGLVLMHMQGTPRTMQENPHYDDVVAEVRDYLAQRAAAAMAAGARREAIVIDPGIGFGKTMAHNLTLIRRLGALKETGFPVLLGASNKRFIGLITGRDDPGQRLWGTVGAHVAGAMLGADIVRVHEVAPLREALAVADAVMGA